MVDDSWRPTKRRPAGVGSDSTPGQVGLVDSAEPASADVASTANAGVVDGGDWTPTKAPHTGGITSGWEVATADTSDEAAAENWANLPAAPTREQASKRPAKAPRSRRRRARAAIITALILVLAAGGGVVGWKALNAAAMKDVALAYMTAIENADAVAALALLDHVPADDGMLNAATLQRAVRPANVTVEANINDTVTAKYTLGGEPQATTLALSHTDQGWRISSGLGVVSLPTVAAVRVDGAEPTAPLLGMSMFPARYHITSASGLVDFGTPVANPNTPTTLTGEIGADGRQAAVEAWRGYVGTCAAGKSIQPTGCPFGITLTEGWEVVTDTIQWAVIGDPWAEATLAETAVPGTVEAKTTLTMALQATYRNGDREITRTDTVAVTVWMVADLLTNATPSVTWRPV